MAQLDDLNALSERIYRYFEKGNLKLTRRRLLLLQKLLFIDADANAVARLLAAEPRYLDGAAMIMRSMYDLSINVDWILHARTNKRLWRWLRDDRKILHDRLRNIIDLRTSYPRLNIVGDPLLVWQSVFLKVDKELNHSSQLAGVNTNTREEPLLQKVKSLGIKVEHLHHLMFWQFSTKTHASASGLQDLVALNPLRLQRRTDKQTGSQELEAEMFMRTTLLWYSAHVKQTAVYLKIFTAEAQNLYKVHTQK